MAPSDLGGDVLYRAPDDVKALRVISRILAMRARAWSTNEVRSLLEEGGERAVPARLEQQGGGEEGESVVSDGYD